MPQPATVYDPEKDETHYWIQGKRFTVKGDLNSKENMSGMHNDFVRNSSGGIDIPGTIKDVGMSAIPALVSVLMPEATIAKPLSPLINKAATSMGLGTLLDQVMSAVQGKNRPILDSAASSAGYTGIGLAPELIPGLGNLGVELKGLTKESSTVRNRSNSGTARTSSSTTGSSGPEMTPGPQIWEPLARNADGTFIKGTKKFNPGPDISTGNYLNASNTQGTTASSGQGTDVSNTVSDRITGGVLQHILDTVKQFKPYLKTGPGGAPILDPYSSALLGFSMNGAAGNLGPEKVQQ